MNFSKIRIEQCEATRGIEEEYGTQQAPAYLVGEKFLNSLETADDDPSFREEIPAFNAEIKSIFERWQLVTYLEVARQSEPFDPNLSIRNCSTTRRRMQRKSKTCGRTTFANAPEIFCCLSKPEGGYWKTERTRSFE